MQIITLKKKNLVWKGVCQSYGDKGKMSQNWGAQMAGGYTVQKEEHGESGRRVSSVSP